MLFHNCPACDTTARPAASFSPGSAPPARPRCCRRPRCARRAPGPLIDTHSHFYPPQYLQMQKEFEGKRNIPPFTPACTTGRRPKLIELMDKDGIRTAVMSLASTPGLWFDAGADEAAKTVRECQRVRRQDAPATIRAASACSRRCR